MKNVIFLEMQIWALFSILGLFRPRDVFLLKFWDRAFSRYEVTQKILKAFQNSYKWTDSLFYSLAQYYLLLDHEKTLRAKKIRVKMQICKLRRTILSLTFLAIGPVPDPLITVNPRPKCRMIFPEYKEEYQPLYRHIYHPLCSSHRRKNSVSKILSPFFAIFLYFFAIVLLSRVNKILSIVVCIGA